MGRAQCVQSAPVRAVLVGVQWGRELVGAPRPNGFEAWCAGFGSGRTEPVLPFTLMEGIEGVTEMEGALGLAPRLGAGELSTDIVGMLGVTDIEGGWTLRPRLGAGDSLTEIVGMPGVTPIEGTLALVPRLLPGRLVDVEGLSENEMVGMGGVGACCDRAEAAW
jgi:hypothetical protein